MMKRLMMALAMAVAVSTAFAKVTYTNEFESASCTNDFVVIGGDNESEVVDYEAGTQPRIGVPYPCDGFGEKYFSLDTGDATLWRAVNTTGKIYFDMAMQFNPSASVPELTNDVKIALYQNSASNIVVLAGPVDNDAPTAYVTSSGEIAPGSWHRVTISADEGNNGLVFRVCLDGTLLTANAGATDSFPSLTSSTTIASVGFTGTGALDDFVARTTDPLLQNGVAAIGGEFYASYNDALKEALEGTPVAISNCTTGVISDGSANAPYEIADANALKILAAAVIANPAVRGLSYIQTADITWTSEDGAFAGIGYRSADTKVEPHLPFTGTYDGGDHTISGMTLAADKYKGIFWFVNGATIKNLTVENLGFYGTPTGEYGCAVVGAGYGTLERLAQTATGGFSVTNTHNCAGILVNATAATTITDCTNAVNLVRLGGDKMGGICCFANGEISFVRCFNKGDYIIANPATVETNPGKNGFAGLLGYCQGKSCAISFEDCVNIGTFVNGLDPAVYDLNCVVHGQFFGVSCFQDRTLVDLGGNKFLVPEGQLIGSTISLHTNDTKDVAGAPITINGFEYATVTDAVGMTVPQADLAANAEYLVLRDIAASATPVATLAAANDYIAFNTNGYNFAGTVAGSSTVAVTESTSGSVITFTGVAGVASVNDVAYATFDEAVDAVATAPEGHQYVELLADASVNFDTAGTTLAVKENAHTLTVTTTGDIAVTKTPNASTGIFTYTTADGVAQVQGDDDVWKWFGSFAEAFAYAGDQVLYQPNMKFKVGSDFTPDISSDLSVQNLEFIATTEDPITINLANGNAKLVAVGIKFPTTATLNAVSGSVSSVSGGTLNVPSGVVLELASYASDGSSWNITGLSGSGTIKNDGKSLYYFIGNPDYNLPTRMRESSWCGTLELCGSNTWEAEFNKFANANSKVRFNGLTTPLYTSGNDSVAIELVGSGLTISGAYESARTYAVGGTITGSGALTLADNTGSLLLSGDVSGFTGNVTASGTASAITFGSATTGSGQRIVVGGGESVTNATGATWTAANVIVRGELVANGTMTVSNKLWGDNGAGVYRANSASAAITVASSWNGEYIVGWNLSGKVSITDYGQNANATIVVTGMTGGWLANPDDSENDRWGTKLRTADITAKLRLDGDMTITDGLSTDYTDWSERVTKFAYLTGTGDLSFSKNPGSGKKLYYEIKSLDPSYSGTISTVANVALKIDAVDFARIPAVGTELSSTLSLAEDTVFDPSAIAVKVAGTVQDDLSLELVNGKLTVASNAPADPWNTPSSNEGVADALALDGLTTESAAVTTVAGFTALVNYIESTLGVTAPDQMTANQKANAVLCYALNASTIPDSVIESATIDAITQPDASGAMTLTVSIAGVTVGETVDAGLVAAVVSAKGGIALGSMSAENVDVSNYGSSNGKVVITVTPDVASINPAPATFFTSAVITK